MSASLAMFVAEPPPSEVRSALERLTRVPDVRRVVAMPDVHLAKTVCVGAVVATTRTLLPDAVGGDIGCGMAAMPLGCHVSTLAERRVAERVLSVLRTVLPTAAHASASARLPESIDIEELSVHALRAKCKRIGRVQFATLGRGNHFAEVQSDSEGELWLMLHSGSRGMGQAIREHHSGNRRPLHGIDAESEKGVAYLADMSWALRYARLSRRFMAQAVVRALVQCIGAAPHWGGYVDCHHNFVRREEHGNELLWVHRKGAISAEEGEPGIIPGSMGTASYHVMGRGYQAALSSSSHGAGRVLSRTQARKRITALEVSRQMRGTWFDESMLQRLCDEAPSAYRDIGQVMRAQRKLTRIVRRLTPILVYKGM